MVKRPLVVIIPVLRDRHHHVVAKEWAQISSCYYSPATFPNKQAE